MQKRRLVPKVCLERVVTLESSEAGSRGRETGQARLAGKSVGGNPVISIPKAAGGEKRERRKKKKRKKEKGKGSNQKRTLTRKCQNTVQ